MYIYFIKLDKKSANCCSTHIVQPFCYRTREKAQIALAKNLKALATVRNHQLIAQSEDYFTYEVTTPIVTYTMTYSIDFLVTH